MQYIILPPHFVKNGPGTIILKAFLVSVHTLHLLVIKLDFSFRNITYRQEERNRNKSKNRSIAKLIKSSSWTK